MKSFPNIANSIDKALTKRENKTVPKKWVTRK
jgi:hypothetical protein